MKAAKYAHELEFWRSFRAQEGGLWNAHYEPLFTKVLGVDPSFYDGKVVLDVGCGPSGSLEWAKQAARRVGIDPLADDYAKLRVVQHEMEYSSAPAEAMPFPDATFDIVTSINSLDHVDDVNAVAREITRVLKPGGTFLLLTEVNHRSRITEPQSFSWDVIDCFPELAAVSVSQFAVVGESHEDLYRGVAEQAVWAPVDGPRTPGVLRARFTKEGEE